MRSQEDDFCTLAKGNFLRKLASSDPNPRGTCIKVISDQLSLLVDLTGLIDIDLELSRLGKEVDRLTGSIEQLKKKMSAPGYEDKVPESVRIQNSEKVVSQEAELETTATAISAFEAMKI